MTTRWLALAAACLTSSTALAHPVPEDPATAHFLANEAVMVEAGETKILFDPLFSNDFGFLPLVEPETKAALIAGEAPWDGIDAVFVSHVHGDHFDAAEMNTYLATQSRLILVAPWQAVIEMRAADGWDDAFETRIRALPFLGSPQVLQIEADGVADAITVETVHIPHAGGPGRSHIQNMAYRVTLNGAATVMHMGDATPDAAIYETHAGHFQARRTDTAFPPYWLISQHGGDWVREQVNADTIIGVHVPINIPGSVSASREDHFTQAGETRPIGAAPHTDPDD